MLPFLFVAVKAFFEGYDQVILSVDCNTVETNIFSSITCIYEWTVFHCSRLFMQHLLVLPLSTVLYLLHIFFSRHFKVTSFVLNWKLIFRMRPFQKLQVNQQLKFSLPLYTRFITK